MTNNEHLAIFAKGWIELILSGKKTIESRVNARRIIPYNRVETCDKVWMKERSGPILGSFVVSEVETYYPLDQSLIEELYEMYSEQIFGTTSPFGWAVWQNKRCATFLHIGSYEKLPTPIEIEKTDRRGWIVLKRPFLESMEKGEII